MDKETRNAIERATQKARRLLEEDFAAQLEGDFDVRESGWMAPAAGSHLKPRQAYQRERIVAAVEHKRAAGMSAAEAVADYLRDAAFTTLNRFAALKMLEARDLVQQCITKGEQSSGYREFCLTAHGVSLLPGGAGYRLYIECLFDELSTEVKVLFDRRDSASVLWPKRATFEALLELLNAPELAGVWGEDETIGWIYQYFNGQDERRKMREESQAPRNSRELAVRNQFFTPRYVVQFLTDNTLGRIWYEMRETRTQLADREYMVRKPDETFPPRAKKDPRDLRVLDPACGSGHFLLYAFDLLMTIYEEAHADPASPSSEATGRTLAEDYPTGEELRSALPGLILAHNLHGVDIDGRCAQIAQLALWMRAQRAYRDFGIARATRPQIRRSNVVVAEPLVADEQIAQEFVARLGDPALGQVFMALVEALKLAGDMGLLLRVEKLVARRVEKERTGDLFAPPEQRIRAALDRFAGDEGVRASTRRRLFADDAVQGLGLLAISEKKYDAVLMNPPFGDASLHGKATFDKLYPRSRADLLAAFVERGAELLVSQGRLGAITSRTAFFLTSFEKWREDLLDHAPPRVFADLGLGVMDAALVEAAAYCLERSDVSHREPTIFLRVLEELDDKAMALVRAIHESATPGTHKRYEVQPTLFSNVPGSPFAYWVSDALRMLFSALPAFESKGRTAKVGLQTSDDFRFVRAWWEVPERDVSDHWRLFAKGGQYSPFYADVFLCVNWSADGVEIGSFTKPGSDRPASRPQNTGYFGRPGLTWPLRTKSELGFRVMPRGGVFSHKGPAVFVEDGDPNVLLSLLGITNSQAFRALVELQLAAADAKAGGAARSYEVGVIQRTPIPKLAADETGALALLARRAWSLRRSLDTANETSHAFVLPPGPIERMTDLDSASVLRTVADTQQGIEDAAFRLYGISADDRAVIEAASKRVTSKADRISADDEEEDDDSGSAVGSTDTLLSWLVGVAFARFDPCLATGERPIPSEPDPFDPLPARSPGMWPEGEEPADPPAILVDDEGHANELVARVTNIAETIGCELRPDVRRWLAREFFPLHIRMYSKSRRKAPIYWQLATPSASYCAWLYIHAFTKDTLYRVQNDYVIPKLAHEERKLESMTRERENATAQERKQLASQEVFVEELRGFLDEVRRVAPLWNPDLDDGVIINFAPLWRLVPHHKPWQKELKVTWDALCEGEYDWAHLAMHLWPERVVPKCATDRSFAIAHGLEEVFWIEGEGGKWTGRPTPTRSIEDLVRERTSPAVKAALKSLLEAPPVTGQSRRGRSAKGKGGAR